VVIAIIGILASMVFPVFARARESARKAVCLSNVKNIALAVQMYLGDNNDTFPPAEHRQEVFDFFMSSPGGGDEGCGYTDDEHRTPEGRAAWSNPYLRWPVVLDEYVKNRDVWNCPSAKMISTARFIVPMADWMGYLQDTQGMWGDGTDAGGPCYENVFPSGWGGAVTDSMSQAMMAGPGTQGMAELTEAHKAFTMGLSNAEQNFYGTKMVEFNDVAHVPVVADGGLKAGFVSPATMAYPDICCPECAGVAGAGAWSWITTGCPDGTYCPECSNLHAPVLFFNESPDAWKRAGERHLGGSNIGWADGHATWVPAQRLCAMTDDGEVEGVGLICDGTSVEGYRANCGDPLPGMEFLFNKSTPWW
jgi:prepilin-type processing-associated H-X9-DG protein